MDLINHKIGFQSFITGKPKGHYGKEKALTNANTRAELEIGLITDVCECVCGPLFYQSYVTEQLFTSSCQRSSARTDHQRGSRRYCCCRGTMLQYRRTPHLSPLLSCLSKASSSSSTKGAHGEKTGS